MKKKKLIKKLAEALGEAATRILTEERALTEGVRDAEVIARADRWLALSKKILKDEDKGEG